MRRQFVILACLSVIVTHLPQIVRAVPMDIGYTVVTPLVDVIQPARMVVIAVPMAESHQQKCVDLLQLSSSDTRPLDAQAQADVEPITIDDLTKINEEGNWVGARLMRLINPGDLLKVYKTWVLVPSK